MRENEVKMTVSKHDLLIHDVPFKDTLDNSAVAAGETSTGLENGEG